MDDKNKVGGQDRKRININEEYEVEYWKLKFGVSSDELEQAVKRAGSTEAEAVERFLKQQKAN